MRFFVQRLKDERSSELCKEIERISERRGGIRFPFTHKGRTYDETEMEKNLETTSYYTHLFHEHCRCNLIPISDENTVGRGTESVDDTDYDYMTQGSASHVAWLKMQSKNPGIIETYVKSKVIKTVRWFGAKFR